MNYIGSKLSILNYIDETIKDFTGKNDNNMTLCDIFAGTSSVGKYFKNKGYNIISNDIQYFSYVMAKHYIENNEIIIFDKLRKSGIDNVFKYLNSLENVRGFIYQNYTVEGTSNSQFERKYFTEENAIKIDSIRTKIEEWKNQNLIKENEYYYLISCLLEAADKVANTASVYEAFLKKIKSSATKTLVIKPLEVLVNDEDRKYLVTNEDSNKIIKEISGDILYLDPPYNTRKYDTNYHMLETIALYDNPKIKGKTGVREETDKRSKYCTKKDVESAFEELIKNAKFKYIFLSYNDEGIIPLNRIKEIMSKYGDYKVYEKKHKRFKSDSSRKYLKDSTIEYIHCLKKNDTQIYKKYLGEKVTVEIDRKMGDKHPKYNYIYPVNYGYIPNTIGGDGEEIDAYVLGTFEPLKEFTGKCIAIIHRLNDNEDKLVVVPEGKYYSDDAIKALTEFQERYFESEIIRK